MKLLSGVVCAGCLVMCLLCASGSALEAGAAKVQLELADGVPLDGDFSRRGRSATGTRDALHVRVLFLEDDNVSVFIAVGDLFAISPDLRARVLELAPLVVPHENIVLAATGTLSGPGGMDRSWLGRQRGGRFMPQHVESVARKFAEAMQLAYEGRKRAAAGYAAAETTFAMNRFDALAPVDGQLVVLRIDDSDGNPIAMLANLGAAPDAGRSRSFSAGFPGDFCATLESMTPIPAVAFFLNGASGDQVAATAEGGQTFADAFALHVKTMVNNITCREVSLKFFTGTIDLGNNSAEPFYSREATLHAVAIDRLAMLFMPPIPHGAVGRSLRAAVSASGYAESMIIAPANGYMGAVATLESIALADGAGEPVYLGPGAAPKLERSVRALLAAGAISEEDSEPAGTPAIEQRNGLVFLAVSGDGEEIGERRGAALRAIEGGGVAAGIPAGWLDRGANGALGHWDLLRPAVSVEALALPISGESARAALRGLGHDGLVTLSGMSEASGVPFAHLWLRQLAPSSDAETPVGPIGIAFDLNTADTGAVLGQTVEWPSATSVTVTQVKPKSGRPYVIAGLPWQIGGMAGVNDRGVALAVARSPADVHADMIVPAEAVIVEVLARARNFDEAMELLGAPRLEVSGRVFVAADDGTTSQSAVVDIGAAPHATMGRSPDAEAATHPREARVIRLLDGLGEPALADAERVLSDRDRRAAASDRVLNANTRACIVLVPRRHELRVMAPDAGRPRTFESVIAGGDES